MLIKVSGRALRANFISLNTTVLPSALANAERRSTYH